MSKRADSYRLGHDVFVLTLLAKGLLGAMQVVTALMLVFGVSDQLPAIAQWLARAGRRQASPKANPGQIESPFAASRLCLQRKKRCSFQADPEAF